MTTNRLRGYIVNFNSEKGFGFIRPYEGDEDVFFRFTDLRLQEGQKASNGQVVTFELSTKPVQLGRKKRALKVRIDSTAAPVTESGRPDDPRVRCTNPACGKLMVPRLIIYQGVASESLCPFCGQVYKKFDTGGCKKPFLIILGFLFFFFVVVPLLSIIR